MVGIFEFIVNPQTGRRVHVNGQIGKQVLNNYLYQRYAINMVGIFEFIVNPQTGRRVHVNGQIGKQVLNNYLYQRYAIRSGSRIPSRKNEPIKAVSEVQVKKMVKKGKTTHPKKFKPVGARATKLRKSTVNVWVGEDGDIRNNNEDEVIGWATVDGSMFGDFLPFKKNQMQNDPRTIRKKKSLPISLLARS
jgi:hypothetical protein